MTGSMPVALCGLMMRTRTSPAWDGIVIHSSSIAGFATWTLDCASSRTFRASAGAISYRNGGFEKASATCCAAGSSTTRLDVGISNFLPPGIIGWSCSGSLLDEIRHGARLRHVDRVAGWHLGHRGASPLGHGPLRTWRDHLVFRGEEVPRRLRTPGRCGDCSCERVHTPRNLRVSHEGGLISRQVASELVAVQEQEAILRRQDGRYRRAGR